MHTTKRALPSVRSNTHCAKRIGRVAVAKRRLRYAATSASVHPSSAIVCPYPRPPPPRAPPPPPAPAPPAPGPPGGGGKVGRRPPGGGCRRRPPPPARPPAAA